MKPVESAELSAFLDGELSSTRASEVEVALGRDLALRTEFNALAKMDAAWRSAASGSVLVPAVHLSGRETSAGPGLGMAAVLIILVAIRIVPKLSDTLELGFFLHGIVLAIVLGWVVRIARQIGRAPTAPIL